MSKQDETDVARVEAAQEALRQSIRKTKVMADDADKLLEQHKLNVVIVSTPA